MFSFILVSPTLAITSQTVLSSSIPSLWLPFLIVKMHFPTPAKCVFTWSTYTDFRFIHLYPCGIKLFQQQHSTHIQLLLHLVLKILLITKLHKLLAFTLSVRRSFIHYQYNWGFLSIVCILFWNILTSQMIFKLASNMCLFLL